MATVEKVVQIAGLDLTTFLNLLHRQAGQAELVPPDATSQEETSHHQLVDPDWTDGEPQFILDGREMLVRGEVPLNRVNELLPLLQMNRFLLLITDFAPTPMIEAIKLQNRKIFHKLDPKDSGIHLTYIQ